MGAPDRYAIREAAEVHFYDLSDGSFVTTLDTLKNATMTVSGETVYARGGRGNPKLVGFSGDKEARLELEDALFTNESWMLLTGHDAEKGKKVVGWNEIKQVDENDKITLDKTPADDPDGNPKIDGVFKVNADGSNGTEITKAEGTLASGEYEISGNEITFFEDEFDEGTWMRVYYRIETDDEATTNKLTSDMFGGSYRIECDVLVRSLDTKEDYEGRLIINNGKIESDFEFEFSPEGDPSTQNVPIEVLRDPITDDMWELIVFDQDKAGVNS